MSRRVPGRRNNLIQPPWLSDQGHQAIQPVFLDPAPNRRSRRTELTLPPAADTFSADPDGHPPDLACNPFWGPR